MHLFYEYMLLSARTLIVEDDSTQRELLQSSLAGYDYDVKTSCNWLDAVWTIKDGCHDFRLLHSQLPDMDGLVVGRFNPDLMDDDVRPRMLALTAAQDHLTTRQIETSNAFDDVIQKSPDCPALLLSVDRHIRFSPRKSNRRAAQLASETTTGNRTTNTETFRWRSRHSENSLVGLPCPL